MKSTTKILPLAGLVLGLVDPPGDVLDELADVVPDRLDRPDDDDRQDEEDHREDEQRRPAATPPAPSDVPSRSSPSIT